MTAVPEAGVGHLNQHQFGQIALLNTEHPTNAFLNETRRWRDYATEANPQHEMNPLEAHSALVHSIPSYYAHAPMATPAGGGEEDDDD